MSDKAVYRIAPATPGLLNIVKVHISSNLIKEKKRKQAVTQKLPILVGWMLVQNTINLSFQKSFKLILVRNKNIFNN